MGPRLSGVAPFAFAVGFASAAMSVLGALAASAVLADEEYLYAAEGHALAFGETREPKVVKVNRAYVPKGEAGGVEVQVECTTQKLAAGAEIEGGLPGTSEETLEVENCAVKTVRLLNPAITTSVTASPGSVKSEIVPIVKPAAKVDELTTLFTPKAATLRRRQ